MPGTTMEGSDGPHAFQLCLEIQWWGMDTQKLPDWAPSLKLTAKIMMPPSGTCHGCAIWVMPCMVENLF